MTVARTGEAGGHRCAAARRRSDEVRHHAARVGRGAAAATPLTNEGANVRRRGTCSSNVRGAAWCPGAAGHDAAGDCLGADTDGQTSKSIPSPAGGAPAPSVRVGETFPVQLTCSALETEAARARSSIARDWVRRPCSSRRTKSSADRRARTCHRRPPLHAIRLHAAAHRGRSVRLRRADHRHGRHLSHRKSGSSRTRRCRGANRLPTAAADDANHLAGARERAAHSRARRAELTAIGRVSSRAMFRLVALILLGVAGLHAGARRSRWFRQGRTARASGPSNPLQSRGAAPCGERRAIQNENRANGWTPDRSARASRRRASSPAIGRAVRASAHERGPSAAGRAGRWPALALAAAGGRFGLGHGSRARREGRGGVAEPWISMDALRTLDRGALWPHADARSPALDDALAAVIAPLTTWRPKHTWIAEAVASLRQPMRGWSTPRMGALTELRAQLTALLVEAPRPRVCRSCSLRPRPPARLAAVMLIGLAACVLLFADDPALERPWPAWRCLADRVGAAASSSLLRHGALIAGAGRLSILRAGAGRSQDRADPRGDVVPGPAHQPDDRRLVEHAVVDAVDRLAKDAPNDAMFFTTVGAAATSSSCG